GRFQGQCMLSWSKRYRTFQFFVSRNVRLRFWFFSIYGRVNPFLASQNLFLYPFRQLLKHSVLPLLNLVPNQAVNPWRTNHSLCQSAHALNGGVGLTLAAGFVND